MDLRPPAGPGEVPASTRRIALLASVLASFMTPYMISAVNVALPVIGRELGMDAVSLSWVPTAFLLSSSIFLLPFGRLADLLGRKRVYLVGVGLFTLSSLLLGLVRSELALISLRVLEGLACGMIFSTGAAILASVFPPGERGQALGITVASVYLGLSAGPFLGGMITSLWGWRSIFLVPVPLGLVTLLLVFFGLPGEWLGGEPGAGFDWSGAILYALGLILTIVSLPLLPAPEGWIMLLTGCAGLLGFLVWETRAASPLLAVGLFLHNRVFAFANLAGLIHYGATYANGFLLSLFLQHAKGLSPKEAGTVLVVQPLVQALFSPLAGRLSDRWDARYLASTGMGITMLSLGGLSFSTPSTPVGLLMAVLGAMGFGFALFSSPNINCVMGAVERKDLGVAAGIQGTMRVLGQMASMAITMMIFSMLLGTVRIEAGQVPAFLDAFRTSYRVFTGLCLVGVLASLARGPRAQPLV